jgi:DNA-binding HxlR family transcriptional regulator
LGRPFFYRIDKPDRHMKKKRACGLSCSIAEGVSVFGDQWTLLIVRDALFGVTRFEQFQRNLGISRNLLARRLADLTDHDLLKRVPQREGSQRWDYLPTDKCRDLVPVLLAMGQWSEKWMPASAGRRAIPIERKTGRQVDLQIRRKLDGKKVRNTAIAFKPAPASTHRTA